MNPGVKISVPLFVLMLLVSPAIAGANSPASPANLSLQGIITNAGSQTYNFSGGNIVQAYILGTSAASHPSNFAYSVNAEVSSGSSGPTVSGLVQISLSSGKGSNEVMLTGGVIISGAVPAAEFPLVIVDGQPVSCTSSCTSEIPLLFTGAGNFTVSIDGAVQSLENIPFAVESPYWNPYGGPILLTSLDNPTEPSIYIVAGYGAATVQWSGVQLAGVMGGSFANGTQISGGFGLLTSSTENLFSGVEHDQGVISFFGTTPVALSMSGPYSGTTIIPRQGTVSCASELGLPEGTCTSTSAVSRGTFDMASSLSRLRGVYSTQWSQPSLTTMTNVVAVMKVSV